MVGEADAGLREAVELGAGVPVIAVAAEAVGAEHVDQDEQHVQIAALAQCRDVLGGSARPGIRVRDADLDERGQERDHDRGCGDEPRPALLEQGLAHARRLASARRAWTAKRGRAE
jgi:hypothetical protein